MHVLEAERMASLDPALRLLRVLLDRQRKADHPPTSPLQEGCGERTVHAARHAQHCGRDTCLLAIANQFTNERVTNPLQLRFRQEQPAVDLTAEPALEPGRQWSTLRLAGEVENIVIERHA